MTLTKPSAQVPGSEEMVRPGAREAAQHEARRQRGRRLTAEGFVTWHTLAHALGMPRKVGMEAWEERMDTFECIRTRRTTRTFLPQELPETTIHRILEAGRL